MNSYYLAYVAAGRQAEMLREAADHRRARLATSAGRDAGDRPGSGSPRGTGAVRAVLAAVAERSRAFRLRGDVGSSAPPVDYPVIELRRGPGSANRVYGPAGLPTTCAVGSVRRLAC